MTSKNRFPKGKVELTVFISEDLYRQIIETAPVWYGKHKGAVSAFVEELLKMSLQRYLHTQIAHKNPSRRIREVYNQVLDKLKELLKLNYVPDEVPEKYLDRAIAEVRGSDPRTINKWKNIFEKTGLIKYIGGTYPNRVVELM